MVGREGHYGDPRIAARKSGACDRRKEQIAVIFYVERPGDADAYSIVVRWSGH
jgi:hypothetical protein